MRQIRYETKVKLTRDQMRTLKALWKKHNDSKMAVICEPCINTQKAFDGWMIVRFLEPEFSELLNSIIRNTKDNP